MAVVLAKLLYAGKEDASFQRLRTLCEQVTEFSLSLKVVSSYEKLLEQVFAETAHLYVIADSLASPEQIAQLQILGTNQGGFSLALLGEQVENPQWSGWRQDRFLIRDLSVGELTCAVRHALRRDSLHAQVEYRLSYERLANEVLSSFVEMNSSEIDSTVNKALESVGRFAEVENSFICLFSDEAQTFERTHQWSAFQEELSPGGFFGTIAIDKLPWLSGRLKRNCVVSFSNRTELLGVAPLEHSYFTSTEVQALIVVPLQQQGAVVGFLGFSTREQSRVWGKEDHELLQLMGRLFITAIQRRASENARRESDARFRTVVENLNEGVFLLDARDNVAFVNDKLTEITGFSRKDLMRTNPFSQLLSDEEHARVRLNSDCLEEGSNGETSTQELRVEVSRADGEVRWMAVSAAPYRLPSGALLGMVATMRDVTEQCALEEQVQHSQKMEAVGRLAGGVAHDFNNVLTAVLGYSGLLLNRLPPDHPNRHEILQIRKASEQAGALVGQLLTFSRKQARTPKVLSLNTVVTETKPMLSRLIGEDVELVCDLDDFLCNVRVDPSQMQQILLNLVINARDAMHNGGTLTISTTTTRVPVGGRSSMPAVPEGEYAMISVSDTGSGMTQRVKTHLFEPFFTTKDEGKGTGLGLATVYGIVQSSGGHITVQSELGRGTTFRIVLPRVQSETDFFPMNARLEKLRTGNETVLLVEDEDSVRSLLSEVLQMSGYRVLEASHGRDAVRFSRKFKEPIDLLITDVVMPHMGGRETAERICRFREETKVLVISGYLHDGATLSQFGSQPCRLLEKPFTPFDFSEAVRQALDSPLPRSEFASESWPKTTPPEL